jgi:HD-like signal output (HDOD) protein
MGTKTILLAIADPKALADISQALGTEWMPTPVRNEPEAVSQLKRYAFTALLVDFNLGSPDASELLNLALTERPETARFLLAYEADLALVAAKVTGTHHILPKPVEIASLKRRIEEGVAEQDSNGAQTGSAQAAAQGASAKIPAVYSEVLKALEAPDVTNQELGEIIARDEALTAEVMRLAASSYLSLPRNFTHPSEAVESLGRETLKTLVMALRYLAEQSHLRPGYLSFDELWQHSTNVAQIARDLVLFETKDKALAAEAFAAGLVHDFGKVTLVANFDDLYGRVHSLARHQPVALWEVEKEMFGASHGEIGGCLVGMWNLPFSVVEAIASHHEPPVGEQQQITPLAAVHIANVLEHQLRPSGDSQVGPTIDTRFLNGLGLLERLPVWRAAFAKRSSAGLERGVASAKTEPFEASAPALSSASPPRTANQLAGPVAATRTATTGQPDRVTGAGASLGPRFSGRRWLYTGAAAALLVLATLWLQALAMRNAPAPVRALTRSEAPQAVSPAPAPAVASVAVPPAEPSEPASQEAPAAPKAFGASAVSEAVPASPDPEPASEITSQATVPQAVPPSVAEKSKAPSPDFRLNGILYTVTNPSAIVNGAMVHVGDEVNGATVIGIRSMGVTLKVKGQLTTLSLE